MNSASSAISGFSFRRGDGPREGTPTRRERGETQKPGSKPEGAEGAEVAEIVRLRVGYSSARVLVSRGAVVYNVVDFSSAGSTGLQWR